MIVFSILSGTQIPLYRRVRALLQENRICDKLDDGAIATLRDARIIAGPDAIALARP